MSPNSKSELQKKAIRGIAWSAVASWGSQAAQFLTILVLARLLVPQDFGLVSLANIFIHFIQALIGAGFSDAIVQRDDLEPEHLDTAFWINLAIGAGLTAIGVGSSGIIAGLFHQPQLTPIIICSSFNVLINALGAIHEALLRRKLAFKLLAYRKLVGIIAGSIVGIGLAFQGWGVWSLVFQILIGNLFDVVLLWISSQWLPKFRVSLRHLGDLFQFGINVVGNGILVFFSNRSDDFIIGYFLGVEILGYYTIAFKLLVVVTQLFGQTIQKVILPIFSRLQSDLSELRQAFHSSTQLLNLLAFPVFLSMFILSPQLVVVLFGDQWEPSILPMQILSFVGIIDSAAYFSGPVFMAKGKPEILFKLLLFHTVITVLAFLGIVFQGIAAIALARVATTAILFGVGLFLLKRLISLDLKLYFKNLFTPAVGSLLMGLSMVLVNFFLKPYTNAVVLLVACSSVGAITYLFSIMVLEPKLIQKLYGLGRSVLPARSNT